MTVQAQDKIDRFLIAAQALLYQAPDPEYANDGVSVLMAGGHPMEPSDLDRTAAICAQCRGDLIYLEFSKTRPQDGPQNVVLFSEREGVIFRWTDCALWAPEDGGPLLIMPRRLNVCFGYDGIELFSIAQRPTQYLGDGIARARTRLRHAERAVTAEMLAGMAASTDRRAA
ncbi:hypothetical protein U1763_02605 [Sphingomonas sp. LB2R24]|uniref:hypothetical protein n=1 Tax=Sphingomonas sorbitolis TaxID=3096165 RepID=UPI002FCA581C